MKYYHISNGEEIINKFIPRVPEDRNIYEDDKIKRICVSTSLDGCLSAVPWQYDIEYYADEELPITVYEFEIDEKDIINSEYLYNNNLVADANITKECWVTKEIEPNKIYDIILKEFSSEIYAIIPNDKKHDKNFIENGLYKNGTEYKIYDYVIDRIIK